MNKCIGISLALWLVASNTFAQGDRGVVTGVVIDPDGNAVEGAAVNAKNTATGAIVSAVSSANGDFTISGLAAGSYDLATPTLGFTFRPYSRSGLVLHAGETLRTDIRLQWNLNLGTIGDDYYLFIRNKYARLTGPAPRTADGKPDLSGVWQGSPDTNAEPPSPLEWAATIAKKNVENNLRDSPTAVCLPGWVIPAQPILYKFVQTPSLIVLMFELEPHNRQIFMDGRSHPADPDPTWTGHSTGKWEGDTLVVDTIGYNDRSWLPTAIPHTEKLHVTERYRRPDLSHLNVDVTIEDAGSLKQPWQLHMTWTLAPGEEILESVCENDHYRERVLGK